MAQNNPMQPTPALLAKIGSALVHAEELLSPNGHDYDRQAFQALMGLPEVRRWIEAMESMAMVPKKR